MNELFLAAALLFVLIAALLGSQKPWVAVAAVLLYFGVLAIGQDSKCPTPSKPVIKQIVATDHALVALAKIPESL